MNVTSKLVLFTSFLVYGYSSSFRNYLAQKTTPIANKSNVNAQLEELLPIMVLQPNSKNVYKKFGIELDGNCYSCDLATLSVVKNQFGLTNVCNPETKHFWKIISSSNANAILKIKTQQTEFILTKIDNTPIYELKIVGSNSKLENLRIAKYYTTKAIIKKLEQKDCGDFQG